MEGNTFEGFTKIYKLSKTLRFELIPVSSTMEKLTKSDLLKDDQHRAESYVKVKKIIDEYHKAFIESVLDQFKFFANENKKNSLEEFHTCYISKDDAQKNAFKEIQGKLRKQIADAFEKDDRYKRIDKKEFIKEDLKAFVEKSEERLMLINEFLNFTTYFKGFHENRKNMYSAEAQSTAIAYRLIHENLPKFIDNMSVFDKIAEKPVAEHLPKLYADFEEYLNVRDISEMFKLDYFNR